VRGAARVGRGFAITQVIVAANASTPAAGCHGAHVSRAYHLVVEGELSPVAARAFEGMRVTPLAGNTIIAGPVRDQAELHALLRRVADLGLTLVSAAAGEDDKAGNGARPG
jgi:hypothetical protein